MGPHSLGLQAAAGTGLSPSPPPGPAGPTGETLALALLKPLCVTLGTHIISILWVEAEAVTSVW